jgi:uncharacterized protein YjeT (DUF2065 family)
MKRLSPGELDEIARRLAEISEEEERLRGQLKEQITEFGFTPPRADKSKRIEGAVFAFTLSTSSTTEIRDTEVERIEAACPDSLFRQLFTKVTSYKLAKGATVLLSGTLPTEAPRNLRKMFAKAVKVSDGAQRLRVERLSAATATA